MLQKVLSIFFCIFLITNNLSMDYGGRNTNWEALNETLYKHYANGYWYCTSNSVDGSHHYILLEYLGTVRIIEVLRNAEGGYDVIAEYPNIFNSQFLLDKEFSIYDKGSSEGIELKWKNKEGKTAGSFQFTEVVDRLISTAAWERTTSKFIYSIIYYPQHLTLSYNFFASKKISIDRSDYPWEEMLIENFNYPKLKAKVLFFFLEHSLHEASKRLDLLKMVYGKHPCTLPLWGLLTLEMHWKEWFV